MSKVALIHPYFRTRSQSGILFPPIGAAALASQLSRLGVETKIFDCTFSSFDRLRGELLAFRPDIVGIYCMITLSRNTFRIADMVKADFPQTLLVAGGPLPTLFPGRFGNRFDAVFRGESDLSFPQFCHDYFSLKTSRRQARELPLDRYAGLYILQNDTRADNPVVHYGEQDLAVFPLPNRSDFDHAAYQSFWRDHDGTKTTSLITTLGCPFTCDFCSKPIFGNLFRRRNRDVVFAEIDQIRTLGYNGLWIADDNFTLDLDYLREFCRRIAGSGLTWSCLSRVTGLDEGTISLMKNAGCRRVYLGLESGSPATLRLMKKRATLKDGIRAVSLFRKAGIEAAAFFMVGYPGETISSIERTFQFALDLPLDFISFNVPFPLPGSELFDRVGDKDNDGDWNEENEVTFVYNSEFDPRWLQRRIQTTMQAFGNNTRNVGATISKP